MQSHEDYEHTSKIAERFMDRLAERAQEVQRNKASEITAGKRNEEVLARWEHDGVHVKHLPPDEQGILRISIGGGAATPVPMNYLVFRGDRGACVELLRRAIAALEAGGTV